MAHFPCVLVLLLTPNGATDFSTVEVSDTVSAINYNERIITFTAANGADAQDLCRSDRAGGRAEVGDQVVLLVTRSVAVNLKTI